MVFQRVVINTDDRYGTLATELIRFANSLFLLQLTPPGKSPISVQVESPGTLTVAANDWNKTVLNFAINITTKLSKKTLMFLDCIFILKSQNKISVPIQENVLTALVKEHKTVVLLCIA